MTINKLVGNCISDVYEKQYIPLCRERYPEFSDCQGIALFLSDGSKIELPHMNFYTPEESLKDEERLKSRIDECFRRCRSKIANQLIGKTIINAAAYKEGLLSILGLGKNHVKIFLDDGSELFVYEDTVLGDTSDDYINYVRVRLTTSEEIDKIKKIFEDEQKKVNDKIVQTQIEQEQLISKKTKK